MRRVCLSDRLTALTGRALLLQHGLQCTGNQALHIHPHGLKTEEVVLACWALAMLGFIVFVQPCIGLGIHGVRRSTPGYPVFCCA